MKLEQSQWTSQDGWQQPDVAGMNDSAHLVLVFGDWFAIARGEVMDELRRMYPGAEILGCSTSGEIRGTRVYDETIAATAIREGTFLTGFYSYGEILPFTPSARCELHNQTMTVTMLSEN